jgi:hypothetical protein
VSDLAMALVFGPAGRNSGHPKTATAVGHLYVGGSGMWDFRPLEPADQPHRVRVSSHRSFGLEILAGFALVTRLEEAVGIAEKALGPDWARTTFDVDQHADLLAEVAAVGRRATVGVLATDLGVGAEDLGRELASETWSVVVAAPVVEFLRTQWNR